MSDPTPNTPTDDEIEDSIAVAAMMIDRLVRLALVDTEYADEQLHLGLALLADAPPLAAVVIGGLGRLLAKSLDLAGDTSESVRTSEHLDSDDPYDQAARALLVQYMDQDPGVDDAARDAVNRALGAPDPEQAFDAFAGFFVNGIAECIRMGHVTWPGVVVMRRNLSGGILN